MDAQSKPAVVHRTRHDTLQEQIYRGIRQSILDGLVSADRRLPSTRSLAADLGVSRTTALLALEQLRAEGYLIARPGRAPSSRRGCPTTRHAGERARQTHSHVRRSRGAASCWRACRRRTGEATCRRGHSGSVRRR